MEKRGQVVIFIIFGIVILLAVAFLIYLASTKTKTFGGEISATKVGLNSAIREVNDLVESCLESTGEAAIKSAARYGGYATFFEVGYNPRPQNRPIIPYVGPGECGITVFFYPEEEPAGCDIRTPGCRIEWKSDTLPSENNIAESIGGYINRIFNSCIGNDFSAIKNKGWEVIRGNIDNEGVKDDVNDYRTNINLIQNSGTFISFQIPRTFRKGSQQFTINEFDYDSDVDFLEILDMVHQLKDRIIIPSGIVDLARRQQAYNDVRELARLNGYEFFTATDNLFQAQLFLFRKDEINFYFSLYVNEQDPVVILNMVQDFTNRYGGIVAC